MRRELRSLPKGASHSERDGTKLEHVRWGLAPFWWKNPLKKLPATFNARAETVAEKPMQDTEEPRRTTKISLSACYLMPKYIKTALIKKARTAPMIT